MRRIYIYFVATEFERLLNLIFVHAPSNMLTL